MVGGAGSDGHGARAPWRQAALPVDVADLVVAAGPGRHVAGDQAEAAAPVAREQVQLNGGPHLQDAVPRFELERDDVDPHRHTLRDHAA